MQPSRETQALYLAKLGVNMDDVINDDDDDIASLLADLDAGSSRLHAQPSQAAHAQTEVHDVEAPLLATDDVQAPLLHSHPSQDDDRQQPQSNSRRHAGHAVIVALHREGADHVSVSIAENVERGGEYVRLPGDDRDRRESNAGGVGQEQIDAKAMDRRDASG